MRQQGAIGWLKHDITHRGITAWLLTGALLAFYLILYFTSWLDPVALAIFDPIARFLGITPLSQVTDYPKWFLYGFLYSLAITAGGIYVIKKYRHNPYQIVRTGVVIFVQISLAFSIPYVMAAFGEGELYFSYLWPLEIDMLYPSSLKGVPLYFAIYSVVGSLVLAPLLGIFFGKRWYCSWVCGCGGLANTAGEPFRHLTPSGSGWWKFEKIAIHSVLILALLLTGFVGASFFIGDQYPMLKEFTQGFREWYGFIIVTMLSGIAGVVLYPIGGTRVWCRNFCPMAAVLGLVQKFGRFRIRVKDDMCISCGMCTTYCEMGIDVRAYAQANQDFTRAACVGCGLCEEVCPRGVLHLENNWDPDPQEELTMNTFLNEKYK